MQEAALAICQQNGDGTVAHYAEVGRKAILRTRQKEVRERGKAQKARKFASYWRERARFR